jgi:hypothetical protein
MLTAISAALWLSQVQQAPKVPGHSVRQRGSCLKVWNASALLAQRPLLVVHDVLKHLQLEDGRLFVWRIADDAVVPAVGARRRSAQQPGSRPGHC